MDIKKLQFTAVQLFWAIPIGTKPDFPTFEPELMYFEEKAVDVTTPVVSDEIRQLLKQPFSATFTLTDGRSIYARWPIDGQGVSEKGFERACINQAESLNAQLFKGDASERVYRIDRCLNENHWVTSTVSISVFEQVLRGRIPKTAGIQANR